MLSIRELETALSVRCELDGDIVSLYTGKQYKAQLWVRDENSYNIISRGKIFVLELSDPSFFDKIRALL